MQETLPKQTDDRLLSLQAKDFLVVSPVAASALAMCWEVGYFARIGGGVFGAFSLSEHINFALPALPAALSFVFISFLAFTYYRHRDYTGRPLTPHVLSFVATMIVVGFTAFQWKQEGEIYASLLVVAAIFAVFIFQVVRTQLGLTRASVPYLFLIALGFLALASSLGYDSASKAKMGRAGQQKIFMIDGTNFEARVLRIGDKYVLYIDRGSNDFRLIPSVGIKAIEWIAPPILAGR